MQNTIKQAKEHPQCRRTRRARTGQWALDYCTGAQEEFLSTAMSSSNARVVHPPNVAAIPGNVACILLLMTFNSSNIHVKRT